MTKGLYSPTGSYNVTLVDSTGVAYPTDSTLPSEVVGSVSGAATDSGKPVKTGGVYNSTKPTYTTGQRGDTQVNARGDTRVFLHAASGTGADAVGNSSLTTLSLNSEDTASQGRPLLVALEGFNGTTWDRLRTAGSTLGLLVENGPYSYSRKTADGQVKATAGFIHSVTIAPLTATPTAGLLTIYDNASESGTVVYSEWVFATTEGHTVILDVSCGTGIYVSFDGTLANVQATVAYR